MQVSVYIGLLLVVSALLCERGGCRPQIGMAALFSDTGGAPK